MKVQQLIQSAEIASSTFHTHGRSKMKVERIFNVLLMLVLLLSVGVQLSQAQVRPPEMNSGASKLNAPAALQGDAIPIQGRLTNAGGSPLNGNYDMTFKLYDAETTPPATLLCTSAHTGANAVAVSNGLFSTTITGCSDNAIQGLQLWLGITVGADAEMSPRQKIGAVPYARSVRPGADIEASVSGLSVLAGVNTSTGVGSSGLRGRSAGASGTVYGIHGVAASPAGYGGYFENSVATSGAPLYANGDIKQSLPGDGLVKAGVYVASCGNGSPSITRSFNNVNTTAITVAAGPSSGRCTVDFGFNVSGRYVVAMPYGTADSRFATGAPGADNEKVNLFRYDETGTGITGNIMVLIY